MATIPGEVPVPPAEVIDNLGFDPSTLTEVEADEDGSVSTSGDSFLAGAPGTHYNVQITGGETSNFIGVYGEYSVQGGAGGDLISLGGTELDGNDTVDGGEGDDWVQSFGGNDDLKGDVGSDVLLAGEGNDTVDGGTEMDYLAAGKGDDMAYGGEGDDFVGGNIGADTLYGGLGNDTLAGGKDGDILFGGKGDDWLSGDKGSDTLEGGEGNDTFVFHKDGGNDFILDFSTGDRIAIDKGVAGINSVTDITSHLTQNADGTVSINLGTDGSVTLTLAGGLTLNDLTSHPDTFFTVV